MRGATMASPHITYTPSHEVTPEAELGVLVAIYRFVLTESEASKKIAEQASTKPDSNDDHRSL